MDHGQILHAVLLCVLNVVAVFNYGCCSFIRTFSITFRLNKYYLLWTISLVTYIENCFLGEELQVLSYVITSSTLWSGIYLL